MFNDKLKDFDKKLELQSKKIKDTSDSFSNSIKTDKNQSMLNDKVSPSDTIPNRLDSSNKFTKSVKDTSEKSYSTDMLNDLDKNKKNFYSTSFRDKSISNISMLSSNKFANKIKNEFKSIEFSKENDDTTDGTIISSNLKSLKYEYRAVRGITKGTAVIIPTLLSNNKKTKLLNLTKTGSKNITKSSLKYLNEEIKNFKPQSDDITLNSLVKTKDGVYTSIKTVKTSAKVVKNTVKIGTKVVKGTAKLATNAFKLLMPIMPYIAVAFIIFYFIFSILSNVSTIIMSTHQADLKILNDIYKYSTEVETDTFLSFKNFDYLSHNGELKKENINYVNEVTFVDPMTLLNVLSAFYADELTFEKAKIYIDEMYSSMYETSIEIFPVEEPIPDGDILDDDIPPQTQIVYYATIKLSEKIDFPTWCNSHTEFQEIDIDYFETIEEYGFSIYQTNINPFKNGFSFSYRYGYREDPNNEKNKQFHNALDIPMPAGTEILASISGVAEVSYIPENYGWNIIIRNNNTGERIRYGHCQEILVSNGSVVNAGDLVATVGTTGATSTGNHLHYEYYLDDVNINPLFVTEVVE